MYEGDAPIKVEQGNDSLLSAQFEISVNMAASGQTVSEKPKSWLRFLVLAGGWRFLANFGICQAKEGRIGDWRRGWN